MAWGGPRAENKSKTSKAANAQQIEACQQSPASETPVCKSLAYSQSQSNAAPAGAKAASTSPFGSRGADTRYNGGGIYATSSSAKTQDRTRGGDGFNLNSIINDVTGSQAKY